MEQMKRRIINIASYEKPTFMKRLKGMTAFMLTTVLLLGLAPIYLHTQQRSAIINGKLLLRIFPMLTFLPTLENTKAALFCTI